MRLNDFIRSNMEAILADWEAFAATQLPVAASMEPLALRDHAQQMLETIARDLETFQSPFQQREKAKGLAPEPVDPRATAAQMHAIVRAKSGFHLTQLVAEYRALRSSVVRLWSAACQPHDPDLRDMIRFNEAIDQALAESIAYFGDEVDRTRNLLLGMLGHDMRTPLQAIVLTAAHLSTLDSSPAVSNVAKRLDSSSARLKALLDDLVDFNRTKLGLGLHIVPGDVDLATLFAGALGELRASHPGRDITLAVRGDTVGWWDGLRLQQQLGNLVVNALKYGARDAPVRIEVDGESSDVMIRVTNTGPMVEPGLLADIFEPLKRGVGAAPADDDSHSMGLGLYIAREIAVARGGTICARSDQSETQFTIRLPRTGTGLRRGAPLPGL